MINRFVWTQDGRCIAAGLALDDRDATTRYHLVFGAVLLIPRSDYNTPGLIQPVLAQCSRENGPYVYLAWHEWIDRLALLVCVRDRRLAFMLFAHPSSLCLKPTEKCWSMASGEKSRSPPLLLSFSPYIGNPRHLCSWVSWRELLVSYLILQLAGRIRIFIVGWAMIFLRYAQLHSMITDERQTSTSARSRRHDLHVDREAQWGRTR
jgi:hypothetical protein